MASKTKRPRKQRVYIPINTPVPPREIAPPSPVPAARSIFRAANIQFEEGPEPAEPWTVVGRFKFWPLNGMWRSIDEQRRGYSAVELMRLIRRQAASPEGVAAVAAALDFGGPALLTDPLDRKIQETAYDA